MRREVMGSKGDIFKRIFICFLVLQIVLVSFTSYFPFSSGKATDSGESPVIELSANPTDWTNQDVTITANVKEAYTPTETKNVTGQTSSNYNSNGFSGTLTRYVYSGSYIPAQSKTVNDSRTRGSNSFVSSINYNSGGYSGTLTKSGGVSSVQTGGSYTPADSKEMSTSRESSTDNFPSSVPYNNQGYRGTLTKNGSASLKVVSGSPAGSRTITSTCVEHEWKRYKGSVGSCNVTPSGDYEEAVFTDYDPNSVTYITNEKGEYKWRARFTGEVSKPDTREYGYEQSYIGTVTRPSSDTRTYRYTQNYSGTVTKPATDTRVYRYKGTVTKPGIKIEIEEKKWAKGKHNISHFSGNGTAFEGNSFKVKDNGIYTVYAKDKLGNESVETIELNNIDKVSPVIELEEDEDSPRNQEIWVHVDIVEEDSGVEIKKWDAGVRNVEHFRENGEEFEENLLYIHENGEYTVYVKDKAGNETVEVIKIESLDKIPPTIELSADTSKLTNQDVRIDAIVRDNESGIAYKLWEEGQLSIEDFEDAELGNIFDEDYFDVGSNGWYTVYAIDKAGNETVESILIDNIDKGEITIELEITPSELTNEDVEIKVSILEKLKEIEEIKWDEDYQEEEYFKDNGEVVEDGTFIIEENGEYTVYVRDISGNESVKTFVIDNIDKGSPEIDFELSEESYTDEDVEVTLEVKDDGFGVSKVKYSEGEKDEEYFKGSGETLYENEEYDKDNIVNRVEDIGFVVKENGVYTVYAEDEAGNTSIEYIEVGNIDRVPPVIELQADITDLTNQNVNILTDITDNLSGVKYTKWDSGNLGVEYFANGGRGKDIVGNVFTVSENGTYTVYASDEVGNETVKTIDVKNIFKMLPPTPTFTASTTEPTEDNVSVQINYGEEGVVREYRIIDSQGTGSWELYDGNIIMEGNGMIEARMKNSVGTWSRIGRYVVDNIGRAGSDDGEVVQGDYRLPMQQSTFRSIGESNGKRQYEWEYVTDLYFMTRHTGFQTGYGYTEDMKDNFANGTSLLSFSTLGGIGKDISKESYEEKVGEDFVDEVLYTESEDGLDKLQRYMIPVDVESPLRPGVEYKNHIEFENMGLSDVTMGYDQTFEFDKYLFGSSKDEALVVEQVESRTQISEMDAERVNTVLIEYGEVKDLAKEKKKRSKEKMHGFRNSDRNFIDKIKGLFNLEE